MPGILHYAKLILRCLGLPIRRKKENAAFKYVRSPDCI